MTRFRLILPVLLLAGFIGCNRPSGSADGRPLEARVAKLEQEVKTLSAAKADLQTRLTSAEDRARLAEAKVKVTEKERDEARGQAAARGAELAARTAERDSAVAQFDGLRKNLRDVLGQADVSASRPVTGTPVSTKSGAEQRGPNGL